MSVWQIVKLVIGALVAVAFLWFCAVVIMCL